ncbi:hypothetical protein F5050DRAFT_1716362, partial [Lentinula boryana]
MYTALTNATRLAFANGVDDAHESITLVKVLQIATRQPDPKREHGTLPFERAPTSFPRMADKTKRDFGIDGIVHVIKLDGYNLCAALEKDNAIRVEAEELGEDMEDGENEFEEFDLATLQPSSNDAHPAKVSNLPSVSSKNLKKKTSKSRAKRAASAKAREDAGDMKPRAIRVAQHCTRVEIEDFDASSLPVSTSGWGAKPKTKLSSGLQRLWRSSNVLSSPELRTIKWDGISRIVIVDSRERIVAVLGGVPPGSVGEDWDRVSHEAKEAVEKFRLNSTFTQAQKHGRRGNFACRT